MNVRQLRAYLDGDGVDDEALVVTSSFDHSYRRVTANTGTALMSRSRELSEDFGEDTTPEAEFGKRINVLIIN